MAANRKIDDFFPVQWKEIRQEDTITFAIFIHLPLNQHIIQILPKDFLVDQKKHQHYSGRGLEKVYVLNSERDAFLLYMNPPKAEKTLAPEEDKKEEQAQSPNVQTSAPAPAPTQSEKPPLKEEKAKAPSEGEFVAEVLQSEKVTPKQKEAIAKEIAKDLIEDLASAKTPEEQEVMDEKAKNLVNDILSNMSSKNKGILNEVMQLASLDPELEHSINVSTYAVIFAMAFGRIDPELLSDLALAGLLHDIGLSQIPSDVTIVPFRDMKSEHIAAYSDHVTQSSTLIRRYSPETSDRVLALISQHHEKFDGTGYPNRLEGFDFDDIAQLLGLAEILDSMMAGNWDGEKRTFAGALNKLDSLEKARSFPEYFDPDIFAQVIQYIQGEKLMESMDHASSIVKGQMDQVVKSKEE